MLTLTLKGRNEAVFRRRRDLLVQSWNTAAMHRGRDLPDLEPLLKRISGESEDAQTDDEIEAVLDGMVASGAAAAAAKQTED